MRFDEQGSNLIFLISLPRSGSTLLQRILGGHPDIATLAEPWLMLHPLYALKRAGIETEYDAGVAREALDDFLDQIDGGEEAYVQGVRRFTGDLYSRALERQGKSLFLDKTPRYYRIVSELRRVFPQAKFVFLLRNPMAVLASTLHTWFNDDPEALVGTGNHRDLLEGPGLLFSGIAELGDAAIVVRYEELVDAPEQVIAGLCARLGVRFEPAMLEYGLTPALAGRFGDQTGVPRHTRTIDTSRDKWIGYLGGHSRLPFALEYLDQLGETTLAVLGYDASTLRGTLETAWQDEAASESGGSDGPDELPSMDVSATDTDPGKELIAAGEAAFAAGDVAKALQLFEKARAGGKDDAELINNLMVAHWHLGDVERSLEYLVTALETAPGYQTTVLNGVQILTALGQTDEAMGLCRRYLELDPDDADIREVLLGLTAEAGHVASGRKGMALQPAPASPAASASRDQSGSAVEVVNFAAAAAAGVAAPKISVVIPSFNQGKYLEQTLRSVFGQEYPNLEVIVMDGGSTDNSVEIIHKYADRIAYWQSQRDDGQYWAVNEGFRRSTGEIMTWINSDDKLHAGAFNTIASAFTQWAHAEWITGIPNVMNEEGVLQWVCSPPPVFSRANYLNKRYDFPSFIQQEGTFWRRSLWNKAGATLRTDLKMAGDLELWTRFFRHAPLYTIDTFTGCFRQQREQKTAIAMDLYRAEADRVLEEEIAIARASGERIIAPVGTIPLAGREAEKATSGSAFATLVRGVLRPGRQKLSTSSALCLSGRRQSPQESMHGGHNAPLVTAIVSTYNSERFIRGCIEDLEAQTLADRLEIIVVDSGSTQNEGFIVRALQKRHPNIRYIRTEERETIYSAWNRAIRAARGTYITNANTDDRHRPDALERMVTALESNPDVALVYADVAVTHEENAVFRDAAIDAHFRWPEFDARNLFAVCYVGPQPMWRAELHRRYGYFDPAFKVAGDYEFWLRMATHETFLHISEVLGLYLSSSGSIEHAHSGVGVQESEVARQRHWPLEWGRRPQPREGYLVPAGNAEPATSPPTGSALSPRQDNGTPLVSVVIATKNRPHLLRHALQSLVRQSYGSWEALIVNDGGVDVSDVIARIEHGGRFRYIPLAVSGGQVRARNHALRELRGDIVCFLDDDDLYLEDHLETVVRALASPEHDIVYTDADLVLEVVNDSQRQEVDRWSNPYRHGEYSRARLYADNYIPINTWGIRADRLREVGYFDETMTCCEDWDLLLRLSQRHEFAHIAKTTVEVRHRANAIDNVTRMRLDETVAAYKRIFSVYNELDADPDVGKARESALDGLHEKLLAVHVEANSHLRRAGGSTGPARLPEFGDTDLVHEKRWFAQRSQRDGFLLPAFHVLVDGDRLGEMLSATLDALRAQIYSNWTATVVIRTRMDDSLVPSYDDRISYLHSDAGAVALLEAAKATDAAWFAVLTAGDVPAPTALMRAVDYLNIQPGMRFIYTDEKWEERQKELHGRKPDFNREYCYAYNYVAGLSFAARDLVVDMQPASLSAAGLAYELCLRTLEIHGADAIGHVSESLVSVRKTETDEQTASEQRSLLQNHLARCGTAASVRPGTLPETTIVDYIPKADARVTVVVYAGDETACVGMAMQNLLAKTAYPAYSVRIGIGEDSDVSLPVHPLLTIDRLKGSEPRDEYLARIARSVETEFLLFLDPTVVVLQPGWLDRLVNHAQRSGVVAVGARLIGQDGRIVHGGLVTGLGAYGVAGVAHEGLAMDDPGYMRRAQCPQNQSAVSSACLLVRRQCCVDAGGFDRGFSVRLYQDVDFCQRLIAMGGEIVWTPYSTLLYLGAGLKTFQGDDSRQRVAKDADTIASRWLPGIARDPTYNRNFERRDCSFADESDMPPAWNPDIRDVLRIVGFGTGSYGSWQYRVAQPLAALAERGIAHCTNVPFSNTPVALPSPAAIELMQPDVLLMHNTLHDAHIAALQAYRRHNKVTVMFGQDDLMFALPPSNPYFNTVYKDIKKRLRKCLDLADGVIVTTEPLADAMRAMTTDVRIVPNRLPRSVWGGLRSLRRQGSRPRVGWAGAQQHGGDLALIADVVRQTAKEIDWVFFGMCPESIRPYVKEFHRGVPFADYPGMLASLNLDLAIAPLERNRFNEAKSNLRILEYGVMGWPVIASDIHPYREGPICRVANSVPAWVRAVRERAHDLDAAAREGDQLKAWVEKHWILEEHLDCWLDALNPATPAVGLPTQALVEVTA